jgi:nucleoside 2-deoxyribosyltransferase
MRIYLAGPLFTTAERDFNAALAARLRECGHEVFLPQEMEHQGTSARAIFSGDVDGIAWADAIVANMDGPDPDRGTCWECGSVFGRKPVVLFRTDIRNEQPFGPFNLMLHQAADAALDCKWLSVADIAQKIDRGLAQISAPVAPSARQSPISGKS